MQSASSQPARRGDGLTIFFTGLPGAGKSTTAQVLFERLREIGGQPVTLLDGDAMRQRLSPDLGFSKEHREIHIRRVAFVASEITKSGGTAICAPIAPYDSVRKHVRRLIEPVGRFVLVHMATPLEVCEQRDPKGLYGKARAGTIPHFTGVSDPYEAPTDADVVIDTTTLTPWQATARILRYLEEQGFL